jgi:diaminohydroxyphosphoribosylaminopyrimidine deaminase/5-amino-6-(5-phosphoribosylamino)uracil reductase
MKQALELARKGWPQVVPNPMVGCVIVLNDKAVASGYHMQYGGPHAEVNAINNLPPELSAADCALYVTLEPCSHHGKTPPCADLIIRKGFKHVIVACADPNPLVSGKGIQKLEQAGINVTTGILEKEARALNKHFITFYEKKRPYIILKWAETADGFISRWPVPESRAANHISGARSNEYVHSLRATVSAIMVGKNTVLNDNPRLTTRLVQGKNPIRVFIDRELSVPRTFNIYNAEAPTVVFNAVKEGQEGNISFVKPDLEKDTLNDIMAWMYGKGIQSLLVEGGSVTLKNFIEKGLWDEAHRIVNPELRFGNGLPAPQMDGPSVGSHLGEDRISVFLKS